MVPTTFDEVLEQRLKRTRDVLASKATEYATVSSRMHNFIRAGKMLSCTPERALMGMLAKHWISVLDIVDGVERGVEYSEEFVSEKIGDSINYLILLEGLLYERRKV